MQANNKAVRSDFLSNKNYFFRYRRNTDSPKPWFSAASEVVKKLCLQLLEKSSIRTKKNHG
jgi:hypothetical protein